MRKTFVAVLLLALSLSALAVIPAPDVTYDPGVPDLRLVFGRIEGYWPPSGAVAWRVGIQSVGPTWDLYDVPTTDRDFHVLLPARLSEGRYHLYAAILNADGVILDITDTFEFVYFKQYAGDLPRVAVGGPEGWDTGVAVSCHDASYGTTLEYELFDEHGVSVAAGVIDIPAHGSPSFNFSSVVTPPEGGTFVGSARLRSADPVTVVYLCDTPAGRGFALVQVLRPVN